MIKKQSWYENLSHRKTATIGGMRKVCTEQRQTLQVTYLRKKVIILEKESQEYKILMISKDRRENPLLLLKTRTLWIRFTSFNGAATTCASEGIS
ncbi:hypothetical protein AVEN_32540-1 [Araneus ventricosus]|uniref:Uncharacterized protein n=1 Tax=Araneus ventricosus TaxID=182803 RepID=A0A4Y2JHX1_ARAVE|nr:hypothetical protein AVEN_32540-1 [Araneus ventricosus]